LALAVLPQTISANGGPGVISVATEPECAWTATESLSWISQLSPNAGQGDGEIAFQVSANSSTTARQGDVLVNGVPIAVSQSGASCPTSISPDALTINSSGAMRNIVVSASSGCPWSAASSVSWIVITSGSAGTGSDTVRIQVLANTGGARSGTVTIGGNVLLVAQDGAGTGGCSLNVTPTSFSISATGGTRTVSVMTSSRCAWTAVSNVPWITVASGFTGAGDGSVSFIIAPNTGGARSGSLTVAGRTVTVQQGN
jgi:hypothetical protein